MVSNYAVIVCSKCRRPKVTDVRNKWTKCPSCGKRLETRRMRSFGEADDPIDLIPIVGELNKKQGEALSTYRHLAINEFTIDACINNGSEMVDDGEDNGEDNGEAGHTKECTEKGKVIRENDAGVGREEKQISEIKVDGVNVGEVIREEKDMETEGEIGLKKAGGEEGLKPNEYEMSENESERVNVGRTNERKKDICCSKGSEDLQDRDPLVRKGKDRMSQLRDGMIELGEFTIEEFSSLFLNCGGKPDKSVDSLRGFMDSGEVYSPRKGFFRYIS